MEQYTVHSIKSQKDCDELIRSLIKEGTPAISQNLAPALELFRLLLDRGCKTVVIENSYLDVDHRRCHARLHHLAQSTMSRYCKRLHFFSRDITIS
jgi:hypothetical protein